MSKCALFVTKVNLLSYTDLAVRNNTSKQKYVRMYMVSVDLCVSICDRKN